jgi:hypothetical protein
MERFPMLKPKMHFEVLPLPAAKKRIERAHKLALSSVDCALCGDPVSLVESKTDEHGHAVHEECYVAVATRTRRRSGTR